jgi:DNA-binding LacI/PurR family transcriptional regulator
MSSGKRKRTTIRDVAEKAGVSISTVSHVLNGTRFVEVETRERILVAVRELEYRPNQFARSLRGAGSRTLGLIISDIRESFFSEVTKAIESAANSQGYAVFLCDSEADARKERLYLELLSEKGVEGVILSPVDSDSPPVQSEGHELPMVQIDRRWRDRPLDYVGIDNAALAAEAVRYLASLGLRRIGYLGHEASISTMEERIRGFSSAMRDLGCYDESLVMLTPLRNGEARQAIADWVSSCAAAAPLDAIVCGNANLCLEALAAITGNDDSGPSTERVALVCFDYLSCFRFMENPIAVVRQPTERIGLAAFGALMSRIRGEAPAFPAEIVLPAEFVPSGRKAIERMP